MPMNPLVNLDDESGPDASDAEAAWNPPSWSDGRMYAMAFDLDTAACKRCYPGANWRAAYGDIQRVLEKRGFWTQQGSLYFSNHGRAVAIWEAVADLNTRYPWFRHVVRDLRMLRVEENDDLLPLLGQPELPFNNSKPSGRHRRPNLN